MGFWLPKTDGGPSKTDGELCGPYLQCKESKSMPRNTILLSFDCLFGSDLSGEFLPCYKDHSQM